MIKISVATKSKVNTFSVRSFGEVAHFFILRGIHMTEKELQRELELYKGMYRCIFRTATKAIEVSSDNSTKNILIEAQQRAEEIYING